MEYLKTNQSPSVYELLDPELISFLDSEDRIECIDYLIALLDRKHLLPSRLEFRQAIFQRESLVSTGIGKGVAVPHAKLSSISRFSVSIGILRKKGIDWGAPDGTPVRLVFLIAGPVDRQNEYLHILSNLTLALKDLDLRKNILSAVTQEEVVSCFKGY